MSVIANGAENCVGKPIRFVTGQFSGKTTLARLIEVQKAELGRKYARVDRRPLDPPPAVLLRIFEVHNAGTSFYEESEIRNYEQVQNLGFICAVDLFPVPEPGFNHVEPKVSLRQARCSLASVASYPSLKDLTTLPSNERYFHTHSDDEASSSSANSPHYFGSFPSLPQIYSDTCDPLKIVHRIDGFDVVEGSKMTCALAGQTFVQPSLVDYEGEKSLMFVFSDLAVKAEGTFILRYRFFDLFSKAVGHQHQTIEAECYGGPFRVYSTKEFPGLPASTELTKRLARWGVRLNIRESERKRRKKDDLSTQPTMLRLPGMSYQEDE